MKILLAAGHGAGSAHNRGGVCYNEGDNNFLYSLILKKELEKYQGVQVDLLRKNITDNPDLANRAKAGNGYDLYYSIHSNAFSDSNVRGTEVWDSVEKPNKKLAKIICDVTSLLFNHNNRGVKYKEGQPGYNWYGELRNNKAKSAMIVEMGFHTNSIDCNYFKNNHETIAKAQAEIIADFYGLIKKSIKPSTETPIISKPTATILQMQEWAKNKKSHPKFIELAPIYYDLSKKIGINPIVTYAQSAKETGYMNFGGVLDISFNNPCGMKTSSGGANNDLNAHQRFTNWEEGIQAQIDHLALYAGMEGYPKIYTPDPRHFPFIYNTAQTVEQLGGKWAGSLSYGTDIVRMMKEIEDIRIEVEKETEEIVEILEINLPDKIIQGVTWKEGHLKIAYKTKDNQ